MQPTEYSRHKQKIVSLAALLTTIGLLHFLDHPLLQLIILLPCWVVFFFPWSEVEVIIFIIAAVFFLLQNLAVLSVGGFSFKHKDMLLMPYYEPFLWGFYYLNIKRFISEAPAASAPLERKAFGGLFVTILAFSLFAGNSRLLFGATLFSTAVLLIMFHTAYDLYYALYALALGFVIELFGVSSGLWAYPAPDFLGIPYWFATMWLSVGILGRRFLIPASEWISQSLAGMR